MCLFCDKIKNKDYILKNDLAVAFFDSFPVNDGHMLVIPKRHAETYFDLTKEEIEAMFLLSTECKKLIEKKFKPDGYNVGFNVNESAGQTIFHAHMHVIPRYRGDIPSPRGGIRNIVPNKIKY